MPVDCKNKKWNFWLGTVLNNCLYIGMSVYFILYTIELFGYSSNSIYTNTDNITLYNNQLIATKKTTYEPEITVLFMGMVFHILAFDVTGIVFNFYGFKSIRIKYTTIGSASMMIVFSLLLIPSLDSANKLKGGITEGTTNYHSGWSGYDSNDPTSPILNCSDQDAKLVYNGNMTTTNCWVYLVSGTLTDTFSQCCGLWSYDTSNDMEQINQTYIHHVIYYCITCIAIIGLEFGFTCLKYADVKEKCGKKSRQILPFRCSNRKEPNVTVVI